MAGGGLQKVKSDGRWEVEERDEVKQTDGVFHEDSEGAQRLRLATRGRTPATPVAIRPRRPNVATSASEAVLRSLDSPSTRRGAA